jgi:hypothetical protein
VSALEPLALATNNNKTLTEGGGGDHHAGHNAGAATSAAAAAGSSEHNNNNNINNNNKGAAQFVLSMDDSILAEMSDDRGGVGGGFDLGSTVAAIMHHAPVLQSRHVAVRSLSISSIHSQI